MTDSKRRYYNPSTLIIEVAEPAYAAMVGLIPFDGDTDEVEVDKNDVERAIISDGESEERTDDESGEESFTATPAAGE